MTERKKYEPKDEYNPHCEHCGMNLSYHDFDQGATAYFCKPLLLDVADRNAARGILSVQEVRAAAATEDDSFFHPTSVFVPSKRYTAKDGKWYVPLERKPYYLDEACDACGARRGDHQAETLNCSREAVLASEERHRAFTAAHESALPAAINANTPKAIDPLKEKEAQRIAERTGLTAPAILKRAAQHMEDRAAARDQPGGERSMERTVKAFNALTGHQISERDGWMFMVALKAARACTTQTGLSDDYEDGAAYFGLAGESAQR